MNTLSSLKRETRRAALLLSLAAFLLIPAARAQTADSARDVVRRSFDVAPGGTLQLEADRGRIDVATDEGRTLRVEVERVVDADTQDQVRQVLRRHRVSFEQDGSTVRVTAAYDGGNGGLWNWRGDDGDRLEVRIRVQMPRRFDVHFATGAGSVTLADVEGQVTGETGAGNVRLEAVRGRVDISSGAGNVEVGRVDGALAVETGAGNIKLRDVRGRLRVNTGAGNISATITEQPDAASSLESGAGNVAVYLSDRVRAEVRASTGVGSASTDFPLTVNEGWMGTTIEGGIGEGGPPLRLSAGMGNVTIKRQ